MKPDNSKVFLLVLLLAIVGLFAGCGEQIVQIDQGWSSPTGVTATKVGLVGGIRLQKWHNTIIVLQGLDDATAKCFLMGRGSNSWSEATLSGIPEGFFWAYPAVDQPSDTIFFEQGYTESNHLVMKVAIGQFTGQAALQNVKEQIWRMHEDEFFGANGHNVRFSEWNEPGKRGWITLGLGFANDSKMYIPFSVEGFTYDEKGTATDRGPYVDGVFRSDDSGMTWKLERIANFDAFDPSVCKSRDCYYYFAAGGMGTRGRCELWFSRKPVNENSWNPPKSMTRTFAYGTGGHYVAVANDNMIHACWTDSRHNKWRFNPEGPIIENDDIIYRHRKDSDIDWSKDEFLSKGLLYSYAPSMSVEGSKIVVAWAGIQTAGKKHTQYDPNDIYYATSKDGGNTWSMPLQVTDGAKNGVTSGEPQVMLLNGTIHLFYTQGKRETHQSPWPIYYQQRAFPE